MRLQIASDLHLEFHQDGGRKFISEMDPDLSDALVLAGDICGHRDIRYTLERFVENGFEKIFYVLGNHEFYHDNIYRMLSKIEGIGVSFGETVEVLNNKVVEWEGRRFLGGTMWFPFEQDCPKYEEMLNDFALIKGFDPYTRNRTFRDFYGSRGMPGDIVVTHHLPHPNSINPMFQHSPTNRFFLSDMSDLIEINKPALWVHGHTHSRSDYKLDNGTRVVCNPLGYKMESTNFDSNFVVEI